MVVTNNDAWRLYKNTKIKTYNESLEYIEQAARGKNIDKSSPSQF